jgi:hypothetical protein
MKRLIASLISNTGYVKIDLFQSKIYNQLMDISKVLGILSKEFNSHNIKYAVIGGFAMNAMGLVRSTIDLDLLVLTEDTAKLKTLFESLGYKCAYKTENVSQYTSPSQDLGEIDLIHAFRPVSLKMLERSKKISLLNGTISINVLSPEDIIGLKVQAFSNDESRKMRELEDIHLIMKQFNKELDWKLIEQHFDLFEQKNLFTELKEKYG